jgi:hypothetical protein
MSADPFNSKNGYSVGIPPIPVIDGNADIVANSMVVGNVIINGDQIVTGNISANVFTGTFEGNISGNLVVPGANTWIIFNDDGTASASQFFTFDKDRREVIVDGTLSANSIGYGIGNNQFSTTSTILATTASAAIDQSIVRTNATQVCAMDYTVIATERTSGRRQVSKLMAGVLDIEVQYYEYGTIHLPIGSGIIGDFKVQYINGNVELTVTPVTANLIDYRIMITSYKE